MQGPESVLEELFLHTVEKYTPASIGVLPQVSVSTANGDFRLDVVFTLGGSRRAGVELDGGSHIDTDADLWRDAAILLSGFVPSIARIRGRYLFRHPHLVWWLLGRLYPWILTARATTVLDRQVQMAGHGNRSAMVSDHFGLVEFDVPMPENADDEKDCLPSWDLVSVCKRTVEDPDVVPCIEWLRRNPQLSARHVRQLAADANR